MKEFNTVGGCIPEKHYMVDISNKLDQIEKMVVRGNYFTINKPRQYGKTTTMYLLAKRLEKKDFLVIRMSFEEFDQQIYSHYDVFIEEFLLTLRDILEFKGNDNLAKFIEEQVKSIDNMKKLSRFITRFCHKVNKRVVLMIDEVDKSSNNQLFLDFLGMLRNKYLLMEQSQDLTFHSIILAGVHDVKNLKIKLRPEEEKKYNSPWNIAVDFEVEMDFSPEEIVTMLRDYKENKKIDMNIKEIADRIYYYTSGYPFLVSKLSQIIDQEIIQCQNKDSWQLEDVDAAVNKLLKKSNTNFESLIKNLENNEKLYNLVHDIIVEGKEISYNKDNPVINLGDLYGIFENKEGLLKIHNRIYEQRIYNYMISRIETDVDPGFYNFKDNFLKTDGSLDFKEVLRKFQQFVKEQYSDKDQLFLERHGRLLFLAFIKPIINGRGFDFKEVQVSQEKRLDVVITFERQKYIVELKIWRGEKYHEQGLEQLVDYLERQHVDQGYLISFNFNQNKEYKEEEIHKSGKDIFAVWV